MRAFIAIALPDEIKLFLSRVQAGLKAAGADVKWVAPQNIHLTLKFLGEIDDARVEKCSLIMEEIASHTGCFSARLSEIGAFPGINSPRVIWIGIDKGNDEVKRLAGELETKTLAVGFSAEDRPFSSHITIGRTRSSSRRQELAKALSAANEGLFKETPEFRVKNITLFQSTLTPKGPVYEVLRNPDLKTT